MTTKQFQAAHEIAINPSIPLYGVEDIAHFDGCGFQSWKGTTATTRQLAALIRWQSTRLDGSEDMDELNAIFAIRRKITILD